MVRVFRQILAICVISFSLYSLEASYADLNLAQAVKSKNYQAVVDHFKTIKRVLTARERMYQALAYGKIGNLDQKIQVLRDAEKQNPEVDLFKRELAAAVELKADSYADSLNYSKIKAKYYSEAAEVLVDLYNKNPTPQNFTALIQYYNRQELYEETVGLLELYGRSKDKGKIYYTYLCEAQYKATFYNGALKSCGKLTEIRPDYPEGHVYHSKTIAKLGEKELADKKMIKLASRFPASAPVQFEAGKVLIESGDSEKGLSHLEKHLKVEMSDEALVLKADTQFKNGDEKEALVTFIQACKQHQEPRKPLLDKMKSAARKIKPSNDLKTKFDMELSRCKYSYRPDKIPPKGLLGGEYKKSNNN